MNLLLDALAANARGIPELLAEVRRDPERIFAWRDAYPGGAKNGAAIEVSGSSLANAIAVQPQDSVMFALEGPVLPGPGDGAWWEHRMLAVCWPGEDPGDDGKVYRMMRALTMGVSPGAGRWLFARHVTEMEPIHVIRWQRTVVQTADDGIQVWAGRFSVMSTDAGPLE